MTSPFTTAERCALGRKRRKELARADHSHWRSKQRKRSLMELLEQSMRGRMPALVALKQDRMAASPFSFFRGAVPVMAYDLSLMPNSGIASQLCGDAHLRNLGAYAGPDAKLIFDINDFDETISGPFEWDLKRLVTSVILAGHESSTSDANCRAAAATCLERYRKMMIGFASMPVIEVARYQVRRLRAVESVLRVLRKAERATPLHALSALTEPTRTPQHSHSNGEAKHHTAASVSNLAARRFKSAPPLLSRVDGPLARTILDSLRTYSQSLQPERQHFLAQYIPVDVAFKVVGTGSVGLRDYCVYLQGNGAGDPLFLQIKEERDSAYAPYLAEKRSISAHHGRRVVDGQRAMQLESDPFLGWTTIQGRDFLVRQLNDHKASIQVEDLKSTRLIGYARVCGELLARGHARSGDACIVAGYIGKSQRFDDAVVDFAIAYAEQTEKDWKTFARAQHQRSRSRSQP